MRLTGIYFINIQTVHTTQPKSNPIKNWAEDLNRCFSKDRHIDDQQAYEKMFYLLIIREMQIKTTIRYLPYDPAIPPLGIYLEKMKTLIWKKYTYPYVHSNTALQ